MSQPAGSGTPRAVNPRAPSLSGVTPRGLPGGYPRSRESTPRGAEKPIAQMSMDEVTSFLDARGESLTVAERNQIDARLRALGF